MVEFGFSLADIEEIETKWDLRSRNCVYRRVHELSTIERMQKKLDFAEAFNFAYIGSKFDKKKENSRGYNRWRKQYMREIEKLLNPIREKNKIPSGWIFLKGSKKIR